MEIARETIFIATVTQVLRSTARALRKGTSSVIMLTAWWIWKQRNTIIFDNVRPSVGALMETIKTEARSWVSAGANGLGHLLS